MLDTGQEVERLIETATALAGIWSALGVPLLIRAYMPLALIDDRLVFRLWSIGPEELSVTVGSYDEADEDDLPRSQWPSEAWWSGSRPVCKALERT